MANSASFAQVSEARMLPGRSGMPNHRVISRRARNRCGASPTPCPNSGCPALGGVLLQQDDDTHDAAETKTKQPPDPVLHEFSITSRDCMRDPRACAAD
jgi:hypothetical protein